MMDIALMEVDLDLQPGAAIIARTEPPDGARANRAYDLLVC